MPGVWDDPRVKSGSEDRLKFEQIGDRVKGRLTAVEVFQGQTNGFQVSLADVVARQMGQDVKLAEGQIIATAVQLVAQLKEQSPEVGDTVDIQLTNLTPAKVGTLKHFDVRTQKALQPTAQPPAQPAAGVADDPFA